MPLKRPCRRVRKPAELGGRAVIRHSPHGYERQIRCMRRPGAIFSHTCSHVLVEAIKSAIPELSTKRPAHLKNVGRSLASLDVVISMIGGDAQTKRRLKHGRTLHPCDAHALGSGHLPPEAAAPAPIMGYRPMPAVRGVVSDHLIERPSGIFFKLTPSNHPTRKSTKHTTPS